jgi:hypothetical protein
MFLNSNRVSREVSRWNVFSSGFYQGNEPNKVPSNRLVQKTPEAAASETANACRTAPRQQLTDLLLRAK